MTDNPDDDSSAAARNLRRASADLQKRLVPNLEALTAIGIQNRIDPAIYKSLLPATEAVSTYTATWSAWASVLQQSTSLAAAATDFQRTNAAAASILTSIASQRVAALNLGTEQGAFDSQFAAVVRRLEDEDIPVDLQKQLADVAEDPQIIESAAANVRLSAVPIEPRARWILALVTGYAALLLYGFVQIGITGDPVTPELVMDSFGAGGSVVAAVRWAPGLLENLRKNGPVDD